MPNQSARRLLLATFLVLVSAPIYPTARPAKRPAIVLISVDTLRADHLSSYGYARLTSPFIDSVASRGLRFDRALVPIPQTSPSHASLLTGVNPWMHGVATNGFAISPGVDTLPAALRRAGYDTAGVVAIPHLGSSRGFAAGFNRFSEPPVLHPGDTHIDHRRDAAVVNAEAMRMVDAHVATRAAAPMFLFVHYFDCHYPYRSWDKSEDLSRAFTPEEEKKRARQISRYDDGIAWTDRHIGELVKYVTAKLGNNVVVVITADHGEQIGDHDVPVGHADIYRETVRVPLVIAGPGIEPEQIETRVSNLDIPLTLARLAGAKLQNTLEGLDLLDVASNETSWLHHLFGGGKERAFVVSGTPIYTRSIALVKGETWYIKNFDNAYRQAKITTPAPATGSPVTPLAGKDTDGEMVYSVAVNRYQPFWVTFEHIAKSPQCSAAASVSIEPGFDYYRQPIPFKGSVRITVPAARFDGVRLVITPSACAGTTRYEVTREPPAGALQPPDLFNDLVARRLRGGDELYDVSLDPLMIHNILPTQTSTRLPIDRELEGLFKGMLRRTPAQRIPIEILQSLRSLGYL
jgi:arylsulfatase A-like enzyme